MLNPSNEVKEIESKVYNLLDFTQHDVIECEITTLTPNTKIGNLPLLGPSGKHIVDLPIKDLKDVLQNYTATKDDVNNLNALKMQISRERSRKEETLKAKNLSEIEIEAEIYQWSRENNPYARFYSTYGYCFPPLFPIKMLNNKGPEVNNVVAKQEQDRDIYQAILELAKGKPAASEDKTINLLVEVLKQNQELIKTLTDKKVPETSKEVVEEKSEQPIKKGPFGRPLKNS